MRLSEAWGGARVFDHHGLTEVGPVTYEHPEQPGRLVVLEQSIWAEVVEVGGTRAVAEGDPGELVVTSLRRPGSPLIRYRTGDLVRARRISSAGTRESMATVLALEGGILGRVDDMVVIRGVNVYPTAVDELIRGFPEIAEYRVTVDAREALLELTLEVEAPPAVSESLALRLKEALGLRISVLAVPVGTLPRFDLKARRWQRLG
jgi:phenylacetate-CoA ligase